ncbi:unnamed protein product [Closterium sp. Naga37s-1]|nr:unnamed protein product [Closterium sp. Naga37s-1]
MDKYGLLPRIAVLPAQKFLSGQLLLEDDWATVEALKGELVTVHAGGLIGKDAKSALSSSSSSRSSGLGAGDKEPFCVGLLCPEMHVSEEEVVLLSVQPWVQRHVQQMDALVPMVASADRFVIVTAACKGQALLCTNSFNAIFLCSSAPPPTFPIHISFLSVPVPLPSPALPQTLPGQIPLFTNWFNAMHSAAMAGHVIASVPQEVEGTSEGLLRQPEESESDHKAALTCLLLPLLLMERVLKLGYNVIYSDISSVWLQDPLPFLPPEYNAVLPSSVPSSQPPPPANNKIDSKLKRTLPISRSDLGYFSPWFAALRQSRPILLMPKEWAVLALEDFRERAAVAHRNSLAHSLSASESLKVGLNEAITRMVEEGEPGSNVGVLSRWLFPPVWKVMGEREWFARHREEVVAVPNDCGDDVSHREMCFRDLKLWV